MRSNTAWVIATVMKHIATVCIFVVAFMFAKYDFNYYGWIIFAGILSLFGDYTTRPHICPHCGKPTKTDEDD